MTFRTWLVAALALTGAAGPGLAKDTITFAYLIDPSHEAIVYGIKQGKIRSDLVDLEVKAVDINALLVGTTAKRYDLIETAAISVPRALAQGLDIKIAATGLRAQRGQGQDIWVAPNGPIKSAADLKGKTLGVNAINSTGTTLVRIALWKKYGLNVSTQGGDFRFVDMPGTALPGALATDKVDAITLALGNAYKVAKSGEFRSIANTMELNYEIFGGRPVSSVVIGYPERLNAKPEAYRAALTMLRDSRAYALAHKDEVFKAVGASEGIDPDFFATWFNEYSDFVVTVSNQDVVSLDKLWDFSKQLGLLTSAPTAESTIWDKALRGD